MFLSVNTENNITYTISCNIDMAPTTVSVNSLMCLIFNESVCVSLCPYYFQFNQRFGDKWINNCALLPVLTSNVLHSCYQVKGQYSAKGKVLEPYNMTTYSNSLQLHMEQSEVKLFF
jgi:hypothetical protein